jgi:ribosome maturation factor RimP
VSIVDRVRDIVEPLLQTQSLSVYDVEHSGSALRVMIESSGREGQGSVDLDTIARATRLISVALDEHDPIPSAYTLEVSSPGLERPLRTHEHFAGAVGSLVNVKTVPSFDGERRVRGTLTAADDDGITVDGIRITYDDIDKARTVFEWGPAPKPGKKDTPGKPKAKAKTKVKDK